MSFNKGYELKKFEAHWEKLRIEYAAAGMTKEAIQKMYDYGCDYRGSYRYRLCGSGRFADADLHPARIPEYEDGEG